MNCKYCFRPITQEILDEKRRRKVENARNSARKTKANGKKPGPVSIINWERAKYLRGKYYSKTEIAKILGVSRSYVSLQFSKRGWK